MSLDIDSIYQQPWREMVIAGFDFETTGFSREEDRIIEVGIARFKGREPIDTLQWMVNPLCPIPEKVTKITGIKDEDVADAQPFSAQVDVILPALTGQVMLAYNSEFDLGMLGGELDRLGMNVQMPPCIDPLPFCAIYLRDTKITKDAKLGTICEHFGIDLKNAHRADHDAAAAVQVLHALDDFTRLPNTLGELLALQKRLDAQQKESFSWSRKGSGEPISLDAADINFELGAAWLDGDEPDPVKSIYRLLPRDRS